MKVIDNKKCIVCIDFDGVMHMYASGWKGATVIPDPPVPGALAWLLGLSEDERFESCIYSSRSKEEGGIEAMTKWFITHYQSMLVDGGMGPLDAQGMAERIVNRLHFPTQKPAASMTIDDRAFCFAGKFPNRDWISNYKPWNKQGHDHPFTMLETLQHVYDWMCGDNTHQAGCAQGYGTMPSENPCDCGHNRLLTEIRNHLR